MNETGEALVNFLLAAVSAILAGFITFFAVLFIIGTFAVGIDVVALFSYAIAIGVAGFTFVKVFRKLQHP